MMIRDEATSRAVGAAGALLVGGSLVGGSASVLAGVNTWANAWTSLATLAAPWPMLLVQAGATLAAIQRRRVIAVPGSGLLGLTAAVSGVSVFFDGQLGRSDLGTWHVAGQIVFVILAWTAAVAAIVRFRTLLRSRLSLDVAAEG